SRQVLMLPNDSAAQCPRSTIVFAHHAPRVDCHIDLQRDPDSPRCSQSFLQSVYWSHSSFAFHPSLISVECQKVEAVAPRDEHAKSRHGGTPGSCCDVNSGSQCTEQLAHSYGN